MDAPVVQIWASVAGIALVSAVQQVLLHAA
jgi:hypothetical protein